MNLHALRARLEALAARAGTPVSEWPATAFDLVESDRDGRPVITGRLIHDVTTGCWREIAGAENTQTKGTSNADSL